MIKYICDNCLKEFNPKWNIPERYRNLKGYFSEMPIFLYDVRIDNLSYPIQKEFCSKECALNFFEIEKYYKMENEFLDLRIEKPICV